MLTPVRTPDLSLSPSSEPQAQISRRRVLERGAVALRAELEPARLFRLLSDVASAVGVQCQVALCEPGSETLVVAHLALPPELLATCERLLGRPALGLHLDPERSPLLAAIVRERRARFVERFSAQAEQLLPWLGTVRGAGATALCGLERGIAAPLTAGDEPLGVLILWRSDLHPSEVPAVERFAGDLANALLTARRCQQAQEAGRLEAALQMAHTLAHECNNGLAVIASAADLLLEAAPRPDQVELLQRILGAVNRVASTVQQAQRIRRVETREAFTGFTILDLQASTGPRHPANTPRSCSGHPIPG